MSDTIYIISDTITIFMGNTDSNILGKFNFNHFKFNFIRKNRINIDFATMIYSLNELSHIIILNHSHKNYGNQAI